MTGHTNGKSLPKASRRGYSVRRRQSRAWSLPPCSFLCGKGSEGKLTDIHDIYLDLHPDRYHKNQSFPTHRVFLLFDVLGNQRCSEKLLTLLSGQTPNKNILL